MKVGQIKKQLEYLKAKKGDMLSISTRRFRTVELEFSHYDSDNVYGLKDGRNFVIALSDIRDTICFSVTGATKRVKHVSTDSNPSSILNQKGDFFKKTSGFEDLNKGYSPVAEVIDSMNQLEINDLVNAYRRTGNGRYLMQALEMY